MKKVACLGSALLVVLLIACSSKTEPAAACSTGPTYDRGFQGFGYEPDGTTNNTCTPHCGYTGAPNGGPGGNLFYADALPSGACDGSGSPCNMAVGITCCGATERGPSNGPVHLMRCSCLDGNWKCVIVTHGAGACGCSQRDAGADSGDASLP